MALSVANQMTLIDNAESTAGWSAIPRYGTIANFGLETGEFFQGAACVTCGVKNNNEATGVGYDLSASPVNLTANGRYLRGTYRVGESPKIVAKSVGGIGMFVEDSSGNIGIWYTEGGDTYSGDWEQPLIDTLMPFDQIIGASPNMASIEWIGYHCRMDPKPAKGANWLMDSLWYGNDPGIVVTGTVDIAGNGWAELEAISNALANRYGVIRRRAGQYEIKGRIYFNDGAAASITFSDNSNPKIVIMPPNVGHLDGANRLQVNGGTGTTDVTFGDVVGAGDNRQGLLGGLLYSLGDSFEIEAEADAASIETFSIRGMTVERAGNIKLANANQSVIGCQFIECDEIQPNDAEWLNNRVIAPRPDRGLEFAPNSIIKQTDFIAGGTADQAIAKCIQIDISTSPDTTLDFTTEVNDATANDVVCFPAAEGLGDKIIFGSRHKFNKLKINLGTARVGGQVNMQYWDEGITNWSSFTPLSDGTSGLTVTGLQTVDLWDKPPQDWGRVSIFEGGSVEKEIPMYYVAFSVSQLSISTTPLITQAWIADTVEHHAHFPDATKLNGYTAEALNFFGHAPTGKPKWHGENSETKVTTTAGSFTVNQYYKIEIVGTTDFTLIGSPDNNVGTIFKATGAGSGNGSASEVLQLNSTEGANPNADEFDNTGATPGTSNVTASVTHTVTGLGAGDRVVWIRQSDEAELANEPESAGNAAFSYNAGTLGGVPVYLSILSIDRRIKTVALNLPTTDQSLPAAQATDVFYSNPP